MDTFPLVYLTMVSTLRSMDPALEEAAFMSGRSIWQTLPFGGNGQVLGES